MSAELCVLCGISRKVNVSRECWWLSLHDRVHSGEQRDVEIIAHNVYLFLVMKQHLSDC